MKYLFFLLFFIPFVQISAQTTIPGKEEVITLLCHKWHAEEIIAGNKKQKALPYVGYTRYKTDLTYEDKDGDHVEKGTWQYDEATNKLTLSSGSVYTIKEISATRLVVGFVMEGMAGGFVFKNIGD
ncbi:hypothetical protein F0L74_31770 [Chitinophaga agrisoli]|uniref:Lipocalin-like domain-containing protein n=1 Tax=Chitinophaga agrisoli TaxID=2607653 RepID=A0A5B2VR57_9BACT|nr:lipocalin family protein [Chitinophaga agrisoli]KAA2240722.1 hypothetical protein F0L74_31770 [Chitinophaga agrisoli]